MLKFLKTYSPHNIYFELYYRWKNWRSASSHPQKVGAFYDEFHDQFMNVYGEIIQAFRTKDVEKLLEYELNSIGIQDGDRILDCGCGVGGPARYFASKRDIDLKAISVSKVQIQQAQEFTTNSTEFVCGDYHQVHKIFPSASFDKVYFLESFGHSTAKENLLQSVWQVLKPGGELYIKDLFEAVSGEVAIQKRIKAEVAQINKMYHYDVPTMSDFVNMVREIGFVIVFIKTIDIKLEDFEDLTISNEFQNLTGIYKIESFDDYIFPVDFYEVKLYKPGYNMEQGKDRYFLQNLFRQQKLN
jgi:cyclopropane fatty-acyl-phospholipid synthase-like methyltransferase